MKEQGYNVTGITLKLYDDSASASGRQYKKGRYIIDAKRDQTLYYLTQNFCQKKFKTEVIDSFINSYVAGETPIPCVQCNQTVKFRDLFRFSKELRADALVTGHYVTDTTIMDQAECIEQKIKNEIKVIFFLVQLKISWIIYDFLWV